MTEQKKEFSRRDQREKAMIVIYTYLVEPRDLDTLIADTYEEHLEETDPYFLDVIHDAIENKNLYASYVDPLLDDWTWDRLGLIEKSVLLLGCAEFNQKQLAARVIIDEAVRLDKKYGDKDSYKIVNKILDII